MKLKKTAELLLVGILIFSCMFSMTAHAEGNTHVQVYIRNDGNPVAYDASLDSGSEYFLATQGYINPAEERFDLDGVEELLVREPSVLVPDGQTILWYEIVQVNGKWRLHGVYVSEGTAEPEPEPDPGAGEKITLGIVTPHKMSVRFEDGKIYSSGDSLELEIGKTYRFQMCSNNWETGIYDDNGNGLCGTVVYSVRVSDRYDERSYDESTKTFVLPKGDPVLRTDVNSCFMAYRYHFSKGDYNKQTGIQGVVDTPLESLSVNLPLGSTVRSDAYKSFKLIDTKNVFIERNEDLTISYTDYYWEH